MTDIADIFEVLSTKRPVRIKLGKVKYFAAEDHDILYVEVYSDGVYDLHNRLRDLPHEQSEFKYRPHITIARVKKGMGALYAEHFGELDGSGHCETAVYSDADKNRTAYPLGRQVTVEKAAMSYLSGGSGGTLVPPASGARKRKRKIRRILKSALDEVGIQGDSSLTLPLHATDFDAEEFIFGKAFNPSEPRDKIGQWTSSGGSKKKRDAYVMPAPIGKHGPYTVASTANAIDHTSRAAFSKSVAAAVGEEHAADAHAVVAAIPDAALNRLAGSGDLVRLKSINSHETTDSVRDAFYRLVDEGGPRTEPRLRKPIAGYYDNIEGAIDLNGGSVRGILAHEIGHALDQNDEMDDYEYSDSEEFHNAWLDEMRYGQLSDYASVNRREGFAEFCRLIYAFPGGRLKAEELFPLTFAFFQKHGLIEGDTHEA